MAKSFGVSNYDLYWLSRFAKKGMSSEFGARHYAITSLIHNYLPLGKTILDFGIGQGKMIKNLIGKYQVYAVEISQVIIDQFKDSGMVIKKHDLNEGFYDFGVKFDCVIASYVLHHLKDPEKLIAQIPDQLNPGGYFLVAFPNIISLNKRMKFLRGKFPSFSGRHQNFLTPREIRDSCLKHFKLIEVLTPRYVSGSKYVVRFYPDLFAKEIVYLFQKGNN